MDLARNDWRRVLPRLLNVLLAAPAALCRGEALGLLAAVAAGVAMSPSCLSESWTGVRNGSSGGNCRMVGNDTMEGYDLKEGVVVLARTHSRDRVGSTTVMVGVSRLRVFCSVRDCLADLGKLNTKPARADCCLRK